jgi:hypothetical protein
MAMKWGMPPRLDLMRWCDCVPVAAVVALALAASGCSGSSIGVPTTPVPTAAAAPPPAPAAPSFKDKVTSFFSNKSANTPQPVANAPQDIDCPLIDIRQGASTLTIPPPPPDGGNEAMTLKYQGTFVRAARECAVVSGQMVMKVGVQGRIIVGPAGGPGPVEVPLRIAIVSEPASGAATVLTKLVRIPVSVPNMNGTSFTHIEEGLTFPMPSGADLENYVVYIGFDPLGAAEEDHARRPEPKIKPKPKAKPNPSAPTG